MTDWTPKQHLEHQELMKRMEHDRIANPGQPVKRKGEVNDLNPANSVKPDAGQRKKRKKRRVSK